jgi:hypothetical protein
LSTRCRPIGRLWRGRHEGAGGHLELDAQGCPRALKGNSLVRSIPHFRDLGLATALVDSPSDYTGEDGLAGFRTSSEHAEDLGKVIADVRARVSGAVWLVGTSRGTLSAANAACPRSPASAMESVAARIGSTRKQVVTVTGGPWPLASPASFAADATKCR